MPEKIDITPADLCLDEENPRLFDPNTGQHQALRALAKLQGKKLLALAVDILKHGMNPADLPIVEALEGTPPRYRVLEGNRRLLALRVLENPEAFAGALPGEVLERFRELSRQYQVNPVGSVACVAVAGREAARHWIELKHTGANEGAGIIPWGSDDIDRFRARAGRVEPHTQALDLLEQAGRLTAEQRRDVPVTSLRRLLSTPEVRTKIGLTLERGQLQRRVDEDGALNGLQHIVDELVSGRTKVKDIYHRGQRVAWADSIPKNLTAPRSAAKNPPTPLLPERDAQIIPRTRHHGTPVARLRDHLIPSDCTLSIPHGRIRNIDRELRKLSLVEHTNAVSVLLRVFVELSLDHYLSAHAELSADQSHALEEKMRVVLGDLIAHRRLNEHQAKPVRRACQTDSFLAPSILMMHAYIHNEHVFPSPSDLRANWDNLQAFLAAMWAQTFALATDSRNT